MTTDNLEHYLSLSLTKVLKDSGITTLVQTPGYRDPATDAVQEWTAISVSGCYRQRSRKLIWRGIVVFEVTCLARMGSQRTDGQMNRPWSLASQVRDLFEHTDVAIKEYGTSGEAEVARLNVNEAEITYQGDSPSDPGVHSTNLTFTGTLVHRRTP